MSNITSPKKFYLLITWLTATLLTAAGCLSSSEAPLCEDECPSEGQSSCADLASKTCGQYDQDSCLEWSAETACAEGELCIDGACRPSSCPLVECQPGQSVEGICGNCGTRTRICGDDCLWQEWSLCTGEGLCPPGSQENCDQQCTGARSCNALCQWDPCVPTAQDTPCDDGDDCTEPDRCDGSGLCIGKLPTEICNGEDDDCDGIIDTPDCLGTVYRFFDPTLPDHRYQLDNPTAPAGYRLDSARFRVYREQVTGTVALYQLSNGRDHMLSVDATEGAGAGYSLQAELGFVATDIAWETAGFASAQMCRFYRPELGDHLLFDYDYQGADFGYQLEACLLRVWDSQFDLFVPPLCHLDAGVTCARDDHYLPVVTHWQDGGFQYLGTELIAFRVAQTMPAPDQYQAGNCYPVYTTSLPDYQNYIGDRYAISQPSAADAQAMLSNACQLAQTPVRLLPPMPEQETDPIIEAPAAASCGVQIVHGALIDGSLVTVILPPTWSDLAPAASYPIVFNSYYDLNDSLFHIHGEKLIDLVARSGHDGKRGVIAVLTNGSGAVVSRSFDPGAFHKAAAAIAWVANNFHGDRHQVITFGGSRGGFTALAVASNPYGYDYRVVLSIAVAAPTDLGALVGMTSATFPGLFQVADSDLGLADAWKAGWSYPACADQAHLTGLSTPLALLYVLTGTTDPQFASQNLSLGADAFIQGLKDAGTQVYLEITGHDYIIPYHLQALYAARLQEESIPLDLHRMLRQGHNGRGESLWQMLDQAVELLAAPLATATDPVPSLIEAGSHTWIVDRQSGAYQEIAPAQIPFNFEGPYQIAPGQSYPLVFVGAPGTKFELSFMAAEVAVRVIADTLPASGVLLSWQSDPPAAAGGPYLYQLRIKKLGLAWETIPNTQTPSGGPAEFWVMAAEPNISGSEAAGQFSAPTAPAFAGTNWGLSEF